MELDTEQVQFLKKRNNFVRFWPAAGSFLFMLLLVLMVWLYFRSPLLINPFEVIARLETGTIDEPTLLLSAVLLPVTMLTCIVILIAMILFAFAAFSTEKKYLQFIERLREDMKENVDAQEICRD